MKLVIFSICKDEEKTIGELLKRIPQKIPGIKTIETLIISDGSDDKTVDVAKKNGATRVVTGIRQKRLAYRFEQAVEISLSMGADVVVNIDGDLQFAPEDIPKLVQPIIEGYDFVAADRFTDLKTGERRKPKNMPTGKYYANRLGAWIVGVLSGQSFRDVTCGFRAYSKKALLALNINSNYTYTQESFQILAIKKMNIKTLPVVVKYYPGRKSRVVKSFWQFLFGSAFNIIRAFRDYAPMKFFGFLGLTLFIPGLLLGGFVVIHWIQTGNISPYKAYGFVGIYLLTAALAVWTIGVVADMFDRMLNNQEKILQKIKEIKHKGL